MRRTYFILIGVCTLLVLMGLAVSTVFGATSVKFQNRSGVTLYVYYDILWPGGTTECATRSYGGAIRSGEVIRFSVPNGKIGFFNFRTCSRPCNYQCDQSGVWKDIDVTVRGSHNSSVSHNIW